MSTLSPNPAETLVPVVVDFEGQRWPMFKVGTEPLCKDTDLAVWLQYARPRKIRELIDRWAEELGPVERPMAGRSDATEDPFFLTEEQALFIIAKSETPRATWMLKAMIQVFLKARGLVAVAQTPDSFGRLEEWERIRKNVDTAGRVLNAVTEDIARHNSELAAQREAIDLLDKQLHRNMPSKEERSATATAIKDACECRVSDRERLMLAHIALEGPATSTRKIGAASRNCQTVAANTLRDLSERCIIDIEQRDPHLPAPRNYYVLVEGLQGHEAGCEKGDDPRCERALKQMLEMKSDAAVHVVPPSIPHIPLPYATPQNEGESARDKLVNFVSKTCFDLGLSYKDFWSQMYARLALDGKECRHRTTKDRRISKIDYCDAHGWCPRALEIAKQIDTRNVLRDTTTQKTGTC